MEVTELTIARHCVRQEGEAGLSPLQRSLLESEKKIRIAEAPTGAGKSYAFQQAVARNERVLFIVPTRRLAQNLLAGLSESLVRDNNWNKEAVSRKLVLWNSDETKRLAEAGEVNITARRIREISDLDPTREGGEMVIAVPEVVSYLLLRYKPEKGQSDAGVFDMLNTFEHIVFDEFHTISPRGFGLAGLFAKLATELSYRAKVSFLSATPLDIAPVLRRLDVPETEIAELHEELTDKGRAVHGDVRLSLCGCESLPELIRQHMDAVAQEIAKGRQVVIIYNKLADLQLHLTELEQIFRGAGIHPGRVLLVNSIDDSRVNRCGKGFFAAGRHEDPEAFDVLVATASVEMGVTFRANLLFMEPGFEAMNFLQRYGRAARGAHDGQVFVRFDDKMLNKSPWFRQLKRWAEKHNDDTVAIHDLTNVLSQASQKRFKDCPEEGRKHFGKLPNRAAYSSGLYWNVLMGHFSNIKYRWDHLKTHQPKPAKQIYWLLKTVREMASDREFGESAKDWCDRFENEARTLRDIGKGIRILEDDGRGDAFHAQEIWVRRNTDILDRFPLLMADDGLEEIRIPGKLGDFLLEKGNFVKATRNARFPHTPYTAILRDDAFIVEEWAREFQKGAGADPLAWELYPEAMKAAEKLVRLTGLIVSDDEDVDAGSGVL
ncbi:DEAD/DEAH box helicase [Desulfonema magnum]|uniref:DEAD/DEAH box helicase domain-containing protein n=1 Tax=Desulfonema magnum TaxID=45655 RepID=A0A975BMH0_9BACT|nr:DEAD/DEAH box helicase [Desulfonema magnum]QTA88208.1 DEAD/DEAH box helicase domain-containing protein [Desulfonema magnum]